LAIIVKKDYAAVRLEHCGVTVRSAATFDANGAICEILDDVVTDKWRNLPDGEAAVPSPASAVERQEEAGSAVQDPPRRFVRTFRRQPESIMPPDSIVSRASSVMERVAVTSIAELEGLIKELEQLRDFLRQESGRIQREIEGYARLSEEATKSTKIIAESVAQWKNALESIAGRRL